MRANNIKDHRQETTTETPMNLCPARNDPCKGRNGGVRKIAEPQTKGSSAQEADFAKSQKQPSSDIAPNWGIGVLRSA